VSLSALADALRGLTLDQAKDALAKMPAPVQEAVVAEALEMTKGRSFIPTPGPQTLAYFSKADVLLFGGSPGGGKTALEVGLALDQHHRALIVRRNFVDLAGVLHTLDNIVGKVGAAVGGNRPVYRKADGGVIDFMGLGEDLGGKQGNPHDLICVDEAAQVPENQVRMLIGWLRPKEIGQRCRMVLGSNPPLDSTGDWLIEYFAPWLDPHHANPAEEGELRYFLPRDEGQGDRECSPDDFVMMHGVKVKPQSRTFISSKFTDNPYYDPEQYAKALAGLPDSARNKLISGSFLVDRTDDEWQAIPTAWIRAAMARWRETPPVGVPLCSIGVDVAQGGADSTTLARRHDGWFAPLINVPGKDTPGGTDVAALVMKYRHDNAKVVIDVGGGWGGDAHGHLCKNQVDSLAYMGVKKSTKRTKDNQLTFSNVRTEAYWRLREALDPDQRGGSCIALPNDNRLLADLTAPHYRITAQGIELEPKAKLVERLGRSPDRGDAVVMSWYAGARMATSWNEWPASGNNRGPQVNTGRSPLTARRTRR
jgi:hypothetical protein